MVGATVLAGGTRAFDDGALANTRLRLLDVDRRDGSDNVVLR